MKSEPSSSTLYKSDTLEINIYSCMLYFKSIIIITIKEVTKKNYIDLLEK